MESQQPLTEKESLRLIQEMIGIAKQEQKDDGKGWILWGWLLFLASICSFLNNRLNWSFSQYAFWNAFGIFTICYFVYVIIRYFFFRKNAGVKTYAQDFLHKLNLGFIISMFFIILTINLGILPVNTGFILLINLYGFRILMQGTALHFRPFVIGAVICWVMAFAGLFIKSFDWMMVVHAIAILFGYVIPGHMANHDFKKSKLMANHQKQYSV
jgi:hypothetical protein